MQNQGFGGDWGEGEDFVKSDFSVPQVKKKKAQVFALTVLCFLFAPGEQAVSFFTFKQLELPSKPLFVKWGER